VENTNLHVRLVEIRRMVLDYFQRRDFIPILFVRVAVVVVISFV
jgi:hypothetical protein